MTLPPWAGVLANLYWFKRACRTDACRRRYWRRIAREKKRLLAAGVPYLEVHLVSRVLAQPGNPRAAERLRRYFSANGRQWP